MSEPEPVRAERVSLTTEQIAEGERLHDAWQSAVRDDWGHLKARERFDDWLCEHGSSLLAALKARDERLAVAMEALQIINDKIHAPIQRNEAGDCMCDGCIARRALRTIKERGIGE